MTTIDLRSLLTRGAAVVGAAMVIASALPLDNAAGSEPLTAESAAAMDFEAWPKEAMDEAGGGSGRKTSEANRPS